MSPKVIATLGVPTVVAIFLLLVLTGLLPTPLMDSIQAWPAVKAQNEEIADILSEIRYLERVGCIRDSETAEERAECYYRPAQ